MTSNHFYAQARNGRRFIKKEGVEWNKLFSAYLIKDHKYEIELIRKNFKRKGHFIVMRYIYFSTKVLTKDGWINLKGVDVDNSAKFITDILFKTIGGEINDALVMEKTERKVHSKKDEIFISMEVHEYKKGNTIH